MSNPPTPEDHKLVVFGSYKVGKRLGAGGMAEVHYALKCGVEGFERECALKRILPELASKPGYVEAFVQEARLMARLRHPNIRAALDLGVIDGVYYIDMELIDGVDLCELLKRARRTFGPPPTAITVFILDQLCAALEYVHQCNSPLGGGIVHRDISPANIMVTFSGQLKLIDFGIAESIIAARRDQSGRLKGKLGYLSPEAFSGKGIDVRADLFSIGIIAHELLTVRRLFRARSDLRSLRRIYDRELPRPSEFNPAVPAALEGWVMKALEPKPADRWCSAAAMRDALGEIARQIDVECSAAGVGRWVEELFGSSADVLEPTLLEQIPSEPSETVVHDPDTVVAEHSEVITTGVVTVVETEVSDVVTVPGALQTEPLARRRTARGSEAPSAAPSTSTVAPFVSMPARHIADHEGLQTTRDVLSSAVSVATASARAVTSAGVAAMAAEAESAHRGQRPTPPQRMRTTTEARQIRRAISAALADMDERPLPLPPPPKRNDSRAPTDDTSSHRWWLFVVTTMLVSAIVGAALWLWQH